jgi:ABC-type amino acid transport substrate-binding protein
MKMKNIRLTAIILLLAIATGAAAQALSERYNKNRPVVIVCNYKKNAGYYLEIANRLAQRMGVAYRYETNMGDAGWEAFENGDADLILTNDMKYNLGKYYISKSMVNYQRVRSDSVTEIHLTGKDRQLIEAIDDYYMRMKQEGEIEDILTRWLNPEEAKPETDDTAIEIADALLILSGILIVLSLLLLWHIRNTRKHTKEIKEMVSQAKLMSDRYEKQDSKAAEVLKKKYEAVMSNPFVAIAFYDKDGRLIEMNETMKRSRRDTKVLQRQPLYNADGEVSNYIVAVDKRKFTI